MDGGHERIARQHQYEKITLTTDSTSPEIDVRDVADLKLFVPAGAAYTELEVHVAPDMGKTYLPNQVDGADDVLTVEAGKPYDLNSNCFAVGAIKLIANAGGPIEISKKG